MDHDAHEQYQQSDGEHAPLNHVGDRVCEQAAEGGIEIVKPAAIAMAASISSGVPVLSTERNARS